ncbi:MAG: Rieske 2Fe-2S domain-containing protein [Xanthobacteraceae bacterium]|nr:Rieske 2Fe-2S domain-containing protein [Xanthobacteraceae bacterium]
MPETEDWIDIGAAVELSKQPLQQVRAGNRDFAVSFKDGQFGVIANGCNHVGGPLGGGRLDGEYVTCPWHGWKFQRCTGLGEPGFEEDAVPSYPVKVERSRVWINLAAATRRSRKPHDPHPLAREPRREPGPLRVAGISTTVMDLNLPRFSGSDHLLECALKSAAEHGAETKLIRLNELKFRPCEGYYSKSARACTWPCSITEMDKADEMDRVYEAFVHWADAVIVASPIRWGAASSLYFKMAERLNCVQNAVTINNRVLKQQKKVDMTDTPDAGVLPAATDLDSIITRALAERGDGESGTGAKNSPAATASDASASEPAQVAPSGDPSPAAEPASPMQPIEPPARWTPDKKAAFATWPRDVQETVVARNGELEADYTRKTQEAADLRRTAEPLLKAIKPFEAYLNELAPIIGQTPDTMIASLLGVEYQLRKGDPHSYSLCPFNVSQ